jgi:hypothetical protein
MYPSTYQNKKIVNKLKDGWYLRRCDHAQLPGMFASIRDSIKYKSITLKSILSILIKYSLFGIFYHD